MPDFIEPLESRLLWSATLTGSFAGSLPAALSPVRPNHVAVRLVNSGNQPAAGRVTVNLYASPSPTPDGPQTLLGASQHPLHLRAGKAMNIPLRFSSPPGLPDGSYYLVAQISSDAASTTVASPSAVTIRQPFVDLAARFSAFPVGPVDVSNGVQDILGAKVINQGNVPAVGPLAVSFYASADATSDASGTLIGVAARNVRIRPGGSQEFIAPITFPAGMAVGNYYVFARVDSAQAFAESDETNNTAMAPHQLIAANVPAPPVIDQRDRRHHHHDDAAVVDSGAFIGSGIFIGGDEVDDTDMGGDPFIPDTSPPPDSGEMDQPPPDSAPPDTEPVDDSGGWDAGSSAGSDF